MKTKTLLGCLTALAACGVVAQAQTVYNGNGKTDFGGPVGTGNVTISDTVNSLTITLNRGSGTMNDDLVLYLDTQSGGFGDTSQFSDNGDGGREAISGYNSGNPSRSTVTFPSGFGADYAISIQNGFIGVFGLASGGNNSLNYLFGTGQTGNNSDASYSITLNSSQMSQIGLTPDGGQSFDFVGTLTSTSAYRSDEAIGNGSATSNPGFAGSQSFSTPEIYTLVPEPATLSLFGVSGLGILLLARRRK